MARTTVAILRSLLGHVAVALGCPVNDDSKPDLRLEAGGITPGPTYYGIVSIDPETRAYSNPFGGLGYKASEMECYLRGFLACLDSFHRHRGMNLPVDLSTVVRERALVGAVKVNAGNDSNGNPRRGWDVWLLTGGGRYLGFLDEGYSGESILRRTFGNAIELCGSPGYGIKPSEYRDRTRGKPAEDGWYPVKVN